MREEEDRAGRRGLYGRKGGEEGPGDGPGQEYLGWISGGLGWTAESVFRCRIPRCRWASVTGEAAARAVAVQKGAV